tara:strand:+ start:839 stop:1948 length:1110 start_codon:yes stop_codon:yes gene_type:complete
MTTMKNYKKLLTGMIAALILVMYSSCEDDSEIFMISENPTAPVLAELPIATIELDPVNTNNPAITLTWGVADYGQQASINYAVQFASDDAFTNPITATSITGNNSATLSVNELNSAAGSSGLAPFSLGTLYARIVASLGTQSSSQLNSNTISFSVTPFFNYPFNDFYLVGDATAPGWNNNNNNPPLFRDGSNPNVYYYTGRYTAGQFKVLEVKGLWQPQWGTNDGASIEVNDGTGSDPNTFPNNNNSIAAEGTYIFTIDYANNTYSFESYDDSGAADFTSITMQGSSTSAATTMTQSGFDSHIWFMNNVRLTPGDLQFMTSSGSVWAGSTSFSGQATLNGGSIPVVVEDDYDVRFNDLTGRYILIPLNL